MGRASFRQSFIRASVVLIFLITGLPAQGMPARASTGQPRTPLVLAAPVRPLPLTAADRRPVPARRLRERIPVVRLGSLPVPTKSGTRAAAAQSGLDESTTQDSTYASVFGPGGTDHYLDVTIDPQNYQPAPDAAWAPIDPSLVQDATGWKNAAGPVQLHFPATLAPTDPITFGLPQGSFSSVPQGLPDTGVAGVLQGAEVVYPAALAGADFVYASDSAGYKEKVVLSSAPTTDRLSWTVQATGFTLRQEPTGELSLVAADGSVPAIFPRPLTWDSSVDPQSGLPAFTDSFSYELSDLGGGAYQVDVVFDQAWLADPTRVYPVTVDPYGQLRDLRPSADTDVSGCQGDQGTSFYTATTLGTGGTCDRVTYMHFDVSNYLKVNRVVYSATLQMFHDDATNTVDVRRVTSNWQDQNTTFNNQPTYNTQVYDSSSGGGANAWQTWAVGGLYQKILDTTFNDHGIRLSSSIGDLYHSVDSYDSSYPPDPNWADPHLVLSFNDLPNATTNASPGIAVSPPPPPQNIPVIGVESPTLAVTAMPSDYNNDSTQVQFQVSDQDPIANPTTAWQGTHLVASSDWTDSTSWVVDAGYLKDGQRYWWRAISGDICTLPGGAKGICSNVDANNVTHDWKGSAPFTFTVSLLHYGTDQRWAMRSQSLGNGMDLQVNEANGNGYLDYPLDSISTPAGPIDLSLTYNSQLAGDFGMGAGWRLSAGPMSDARKLPVSLTKLSAADGDGVLIKFHDGDQRHFPHISGDDYGGAGMGDVKHDPNVSGDADGSESWTYTATDGSVYTFDYATGELTSARASSDDWTKDGFTYVFDSSYRIQSITDPMHRTINFDWSASNRVVITTWPADGRTWTIWLGTIGRPWKIDDPVSPAESVGLTYASSDPAAKLTGIQDAQLYATSQPGWTIGYDGSSPPRVSSVTAPAANVGTRFGYGPLLNGGIVSDTKVTDPRGDPAAGTYTVDTSFNSAGLPIQIAGPGVADPHNPLGYTPTTTMVWDTNGNLICSRSPSSNQSGGVKCVNTTGNLLDLPDVLNTDYTYQPRVPFKMLSMTGPQTTDSTGANQRASSTYLYDTNTDGTPYTGLVNAQYENAKLSGTPKFETITQSVSYDWSNSGDKPTNIQYPTYWSIRLTGRITVSKSDYYNFRVKADDGVRLTIGRLTLADCWSDPHPFQTNCGTGDQKKWLTKDWPTRLTLSYYHGLNEGGTNHPKLELWWDQGNGNWQLVPSTIITPDTNLMTSVTDNLGTTTYAYPDANSKLKEQPTSRIRGNRTTEYTYDSYGRLATETDDFLGATASYLYDQGSVGSCLTQKTDFAGATTTYTCDGAGDITKSTLVVPPVTGTGQSQSQTRIVDTGYDPLGRVTSTTVPHPSGSAPPGGWPKTVSTYWPDGRVKTTTDANGTATTNYAYAYSTTGFQVTQTPPSPNWSGESTPSPVVHTFDLAGNEVQTSDVRGHTRSKTYDALNRVVSATAPVAAGTSVTTTTTYDDPNRTVTVSVPGAAGNTVTTTTITDILGRTTSTQRGSLPQAKIFYDALGNVTKTVDPAGIWVKSAYDAFAERTSETRVALADGTQKTTTYTYDNAGRLTSAQDFRGNTTTYGYDLDSRLTSASLPNGPGGSTLGTTQFVYNAAGERVQIVQGSESGGAGISRNFTYDEAGRLITLANANGSTSYVYDADGHLTEVDPPASIGVNRLFTYDNLGRLVHRLGQSGSQSLDEESFWFDEAGSLTSAANVAYSVSMSYDFSNRLTQVTEPGTPAPTTTYTYSNTQLTKTTDSVIGDTTYAYKSGSGLLDTLTDPISSSGHVTYDYYADGRFKSRTDPNGLTTTRTYDAAGRIASQTTATGANPPVTVASFTPTYDENGNVTSEVRQVSNYSSADGGSTAWAFTYDEANRLKTATDAAGTPTTYGYDSAGNRTSVKVGTNATVTTTYDAAGFPVSGSDGTAYTVDKLGETTSIAKGGSTTGYAYDTWGRLKSATPPSGSITYAFDPLDRTIARTKAGATTSYVYTGRGESPVKITPATGNPTKYTYTPGGPLDTKTGSTIRYLVKDIHSDVVGLANSSGSLAGSTAYGAWGEPRGTSGEQNSLGFQAQLTDADTGLVDMTTRNYDPAQGRFLTQDSVFGVPTNPTSLNQFVYGYDSPLVFTDPLGMSGCADGIYCAPPAPGTHPLEPAGYHSGWNPYYSRTGNGPVTGGIWNPTASQQLIIAYYSKPPPPPAPPPPPPPKTSGGGCGLLGWHCIVHGVATGANWAYHHPLQTLSIVVGGACILLSDGLCAPAAEGLDAAAAGAEATDIAVTADAAATDLAAGGDAVATDAAASDGANSLADSNAGAGCNSFVKGTAVLLASGKPIPIQRVKVGTRVMSVDQYHVRSAARSEPVVGLIRHADAYLFRLRVGVSTLEVTGYHPFYVKGQGWAEVRDLRSGEHLLAAGGRTLTLHSIHRIHAGAPTVYNFEVASTHTYYVGRAEVLVHNCGDTLNVSQNVATKVEAQHGLDLAEAQRVSDSTTGVKYWQQGSQAWRVAHFEPSTNIFVSHSLDNWLVTAFYPENGLQYFLNVVARGAY